MKKSLIMIMLIFCLIVSACSSETNSSSDPIPETKPSENVELIFDASEISRISAEKLEQVMGAPDSVDQWKLNSTYDATTYTYDSGNIEVLIIDDSVVRYTQYDPGISIENKKDLLLMYGIKHGENLKKVEDTGVALKYHLVSDKVGEFYVLTDPSDKNKIDELRITYNLKYFE